MNRTHNRLALAAALPLLALVSRPALAFTASEDFGGYAAPVTFPSTNVAGGLANAGGAGTAGTGASGNGWLNGWRSANSTGSATAAGVVNTTPLKTGTGNYLATTFTSSSTTGAFETMAVARAYDVAGASLADAGHVAIGFDLRVDGGAMEYDLFESQARGATVSPGAASYQFRTVNGFWNYFNGTSLVPTTLAFTTGTTFSFSVSLNPSAFTYSFTITDGTSSVSGSSIGFRNASFNTDNNTGSSGGRWLSFTAKELSDTASQAAALSVDNLLITTAAIPEPSSCALLAGLGLLGVAALRRRR